MKKFFSLSLVLVLFSLAKLNAQNPFSVTVNISGIDSGYAFLAYFDSTNKEIRDSIPVAETMYFKGVTYPHPTRAHLYFNNDSIDVLEFVIDSGEVLIKSNTSSLLDAFVKGGVETNIYEEYKTITKKQFAFEDKLINIYQRAIADSSANDTISHIDGWTTVGEFMDESITMEEKYTQNEIRGFVYKHSESKVVTLIIYALMERYIDISADTLQNLLKSLSPEIQNSSRGIYLKDEINSYRKSAIGEHASNFSMKDVNGKNVKLTSVKMGKYLLLCFWTSDTKDSRINNHYLVTAYEKYHAKGLKILSVTLDSNAEEWKAAIVEDKLVWKNLSDFKIWDCIALQSYFVPSIPYYYLIDKRGRIIDRSEYPKDILDYWFEEQ